MSDDKKSDDYRVDMPSSRSSRAPSPVMRATSHKSAASITENPIAAILSYCGSSILMTVTNKYVLSGVDFNLNFFLLCVQVWQLNEDMPNSSSQPIVCGLCGSHFNVQSRGRHFIPRLQQR
jgi:hypothetical protein